MEEIENNNIAVLIACHNRREKTLRFLKSLTTQALFNKLHVDIYLLDDGSTDGTAAAVSASYPAVNIITGTGNLYWAGGMRTLWQYVNTQKAYDMFWLFNDDVVLLDNAIENLLQCYNSLNKKGAVLIGSTLSPTTNKLSYGGHLLYNINHAAYHAVIPDDYQPLPCHLGNANIVLVDAEAVNRIGIFADAYTHYLADFDYTLTAHKAGLSVLVAPGYYGYCEDDHGVSWVSGKSLHHRIKYLYSPTGLAYKEYLFYIKKHFPADYIGAWTKLWLKTFFPIIWDKFKEREGK